MKIRIIQAFWTLFLLAVVLILGMTTRSLGAPTGPGLEEQLQKEESRLAELQGQVTLHRKKLNEAKVKEKGVLSKLQEFNEKVALTGQRINVMQIKQKRVEIRIAELTKEIAYTEGQLGDLKEALAARLNAIYRYGGVAELNLFFSSSTINEAIVSSYLLTRIADQDREIYGKYMDRIRRLDQSRRDLGLQTKRLFEQKKELEGERNAHRKAVDESSRYLEKVKREKQLHASAVQELQRAQRELENKVRSLLEQKRKMAQKTPGRKTPSYRGGALPWPASGTVNSEYGMRVHPQFNTKLKHTGIDIAAPIGTPVITVAPGEVLFAGWLRGYGQVIIIDHGGNLTTVYAHLSRMDVREGQDVFQGQVIGGVGSTGVSTGSHLHFEVRVGGDARNPRDYLRAR
jgi:murein DD-endopeptidase MepM/ murein hydrolase activator NlpD